MACRQKYEQEAHRRHWAKGDEIWGKLVISFSKQLTHMSGSHNYDPLLGTINSRCRIILIGNQKGTII